jgi:uncharacterized membrane protein
MPALTKSFVDRLLHAMAYEVIAVLFCAPLFAYVMDKPVGQMGLLTIAISIIAMVWNMVFNAAYDRVVSRFKVVKTFIVRVVHGVAFEGGLTLFIVPLSAWWLEIGLWSALLLDVGLLLFFLPYTVVFNWAYDALRGWRKGLTARDCSDTP